MVIIGVLLLVGAVVVLVDMGVASKGTTDVHLLGWHLGNAGPGRVLLLGTAIGVVLTLGLMLVLSGQLRSRRRRRERDRTIKGTRAENKRLAAELEEQRAVVVPAPEPVAATAVDTSPAEAYPEGADYVVGSRYPHETTAAHTPPAPPEPGG
jgi:hypothetical protein